MEYPFEASFEEVENNFDEYINAVFSSLESDFLTMPKGEDFIEYSVFEKGYEALKQVTNDFTLFDLHSILPVAFEIPISITVMRTILGFSPPEWAYVTSQRTNIEVSQSAVRTLDRKIRANPTQQLGNGKILQDRVKALIETACILISEGAPEVDSYKIHRLDKADTKFGLNSVKNMADLGAPYSMLLYERFLGRPFASHRDSVSDLVGDILEIAIEENLSKAGISYRKTKRAEKITDFDQSPDFIIPDEFNPQIVIEAKITEDDGTARDKVTRIQHLDELSRADQSDNKQKFEVIACIAGRGFKIRREDMKKLLIATRGKVFTLKTIDRLVECSKLKEYKSK